MAESPTHDSWNGEDRLSDKEDGSPLLTYRYGKYRQFAPYVREGKSERRARWCTSRLLAKIFPVTVLVLCAFLYIPFYNRASVQTSKALVAGWPATTNRDTKIYVQPNNITTLHEPKDVCHTLQENKLFLLIVVCSSTTNFEERTAIRETWGNYKKYLELSKITAKIKEKYKHYNYSYDLTGEFNISDVLKRDKRDSGFAQLLPELAKALKNNLVNVKTDSVEKRFDDDVLPEFDMNKELGDHTENYDYLYDSNIMKIPPKGYEDSPDLDRVLSMLKMYNNFPKIMAKAETDSSEIDFKLVFILGLPSENYTAVQSKIEEEVDTYGDIIQEDFIDSYNNLTLKSIMMLKWITHKCDGKVRYILKTDDDMYINVPNLVENLRNRSRIFDEKVKAHNEKEYLLIGDLICGARPVQDSNNKWYSPPYMYGGRVYPRYLSGTGYALSLPTAHALYDAALRTAYFHLEDIYITGMCSVRARPRVVPRDDGSFSYVRAGPCAPHARATAHRVAPRHMRRMHRLMHDERMRDKCERMRLTQVRRDMLRPKPPPKLTKKH